MWTETIKHLQQAGLSQAQIASLVGCSQPTIHRLLKGETRNPSFLFGQRLLTLEQKICGSALKNDILSPPQPADHSNTPASHPGSPS